MEFEVKVKYTYQETVALLDFVQRKTLRYRACTIGTLMVGAALFFLNVWALCAGLEGFSVLWTIIGLVFLTLGLILAVPRIGGLLATVFLKHTKTDYEETTFYPDSLEFRTNKQVLRFPYESITSVYYLKQQYWIDTGQDCSMFLPMRAFTHGDPADFADFIQRKTGLTVQYLK